MRFTLLVPGWIGVPVTRWMFLGFIQRGTPTSQMLRLRINLSMLLQISFVRITSLDFPLSFSTSRSSQERERERGGRGGGRGGGCCECRQRPLEPVQPLWLWGRRASSHGGGGGGLKRSDAAESFWKKERQQPRKPQGRRGNQRERERGLCAWLLGCTWFSFAPSTLRLLAGAPRTSLALERGLLLACIKWSCCDLVVFSRVLWAFWVKCFEVFWVISWTWYSSDWQTRETFVNIQKLLSLAFGNQKMRPLRPIQLRKCSPQKPAPARSFKKTGCFIQRGLSHASLGAFSFENLLFSFAAQAFFNIFSVGSESLSYLNILVLC